jgi:ABC-type thiamine transport system ATPase subunit
MLRLESVQFRYEDMVMNLIFMSQRRVRHYGRGAGKSTLLTHRRI